MRFTFSFFLAGELPQRVRTSELRPLPLPPCPQLPIDSEPIASEMLSAPAAACRRASGGKLALSS